MARMFGLAIVYKETVGRPGAMAVCWRWSECNHARIPHGRPSIAYSSQENAIKGANAAMLHVMETVSNTEPIERLKNDNS